MEPVDGVWVVDIGGGQAALLLLCEIKGECDSSVRGSFSNSRWLPQTTVRPMCCLLQIWTGTTITSHLNLDEHLGRVAQLFNNLKLGLLNSRQYNHKSTVGFLAEGANLSTTAQPASKPWQPPSPSNQKMSGPRLELRTYCAHKNVRQL